MPNDSVQAKLEHINLDQKDKVVISGVPAADFASVMIRKQEQALAKLNAQAPSLKVTDINVLPNGTVEINNAEYAAKLANDIANAKAANAVDGDFCCNMGCGNKG